MGVVSEVGEEEARGIHRNNGRANKVEGILIFISSCLRKVTKKQPHV